ncbi:hypothetical protein [Nocardia huaxiensis]|uniref:hypothetical protein n=1 Tax=Nocardia huaxiensis TaxID=2755382 RepID=UPI001E4BE06F|nr:hypothetical protein [Nocardia huaxiensis]UFS97303.1 hypothetical protein LPY97_05125 [Nocardia huaxiensis]
MASVDEPFIEAGRLWYVDAQALPPAVREKLRKRAEAGYRIPRPVSRERLAQLDSEIARAQGMIWEASLGQPDPHHMRELHRLAEQARTRRQQALREGAPDDPGGFRGKGLFIAAPFAAIVSLMVLSVADANGAITLITPIVLLILLATPYMLGRRSPLVLTPADLAAIRAATRGIRIADANRSRALLSGAEKIRDVPDLVAVAGHLVDRITVSVAWRSIYLEPHRAQFDVMAEIAQIAKSAARYDAMARRLAVAPSGDTRTAELARTAQHSARQQLGIVWQTLCRRVDALREFAGHLHQLDLELRNAELARQALDMDDDLAELLASAVSNELAAEQLRHLSEQTAGLTLAIRELVDQLHLDVQTLRALAPGEGQPAPDGTHRFGW